MSWRRGGAGPRQPVDFHARQPCHEEVLMSKPVEERVREIISENLGVRPDEITMEAKFIEDLNADSLDTVELVMAFEEEFGLEIPDEDAEKITTVGDAIRSTKEKG